uniref:Uncharacterized protein n=1 Tax=Brassica oleracea TaxID=3712 RepID=A0A3P6ERL4_BRAOL|nr:unnamed protein product [Brassica oleracea]
MSNMDKTRLTRTLVELRSLSFSRERYMSGLSLPTKITTVYSRKCCTLETYSCSP